MSNEALVPPPASHTTLGRSFLSPPGLALAAIIGVAIGFGLAYRLRGAPPPPSAIPISIDRLNEFGRGPVAVKGTAVEVFGRRFFVLADASGKALVDDAAPGARALPVEQGETIAVQGRFADGVLRAETLVSGDGRVDRLAPPSGPPSRLRRLWFWLWPL